MAVTRALRIAALAAFVSIAACAPAPPPAPPGAATGTTVVPIQTMGRTVFVSVQAEGRDEAALFIVDTGAAITILSPLYAKRLGIEIPERAARIDVTAIGGHTISVPLVTLRRLGVGHAAVEPMTVGVYDAFPQAPTVDGILGLDFLQRFKFTLDTTARYLRLDPRPPR